MKTTVIQIEPFDSPQSIRDKMEWAGSSRVLLVWPKRGTFNISEVELQNLHRKAEALGAQFGIVCRSQGVNENAQRLGIATFTSVPSAERGRWVQKKRLPPFQPTSTFIKKIQVDQNNKKRTFSPAWAKKILRFAAFFLGIAAVLALLVFFIPSAKVILNPVTTIKNIPIEIWSSTKFLSVNINGTLPAYEKTIEVSGELGAASTGTTGLATASATGKVVFTNLTDVDVTVPAGSVIRTDGENPIRFATVEEFIVAHGSLVINSTAVKALNPGTAGNLPQDSLVSLEGSLGGLLTVTNPEPTTGGEDSTSLSPSEEDYATAKEKLLNQLKEKAVDEFSQPDELKLISGTIDGGRILSETRSVEVGQPANQFSLSLVVEFTGLAFSASELEKLGNQVMLASIPTNEQVYSSKVIMTSQNNVTGSLTDGAKWTVIVSSPVGPKIESEKYARIIAGKQVNAAKSTLKSLIPLSSDPVIQTFFLPSILPFAPFRIQFMVQQ